MAKNKDFRIILAFLFGITIFWGCTTADMGIDPLNALNTERTGETSGNPGGETEDGTYPGLDAKTEMQIKLDYMNYLGESWRSGYTVDQVYIRNYYGTYNGCAVVMMDAAGLMYLTAITGFTVAGIPFSYPDSNVARVWKQAAPDGSGRFYGLKEAYDLGFLTQEDVRSIYERHYGANYERNDATGDPSVVRPVTASRGYDDILPVSGGWIAVGRLYGLPLDAVIAKFDSQGNIVWEKAFGGSDLDEFYSVIEISDGYIVRAGSASNDGNLSGLKQGTRGRVTSVTVKYDKNGELLWTKELFYISAVANDAGFFAVDGINFKQYDTNGNVVWKKPIYEEGNNLYISKIFKGPDGVYFSDRQADNYIIGSINDTDGTVRWKKAFPISLSSISGIIVTNDGFVVADRMTVEKFSLEMDSVWKISYQQAAGSISDMAEIGGNIFVVGNNSANKNKPFIFGIDTNGEIFWDSGLQGAEGEDCTYYRKIFRKDDGFIVYRHAYNYGEGEIPTNSFLFFEALAFTAR